ncbi:MAG: signal transduction histidine kinase [halophilic archaeon J07HX5]|nr:MAG: signal transduction histidine kinase [halophilic archaeon J07HX5]
MLGLPPDSLFQAVSWVRWGSSLGGGVGLAIGIFEARGIERAVEVERERVRAEAAASQEEFLEYLNTMLRHEVLNTATVVGLHADLITQECATDAVADRAETIITHTSEMEQVIKDGRLLVQASKDQADSETVDITAVLADEIAKLERAEVPVSVTASLPERALVDAGTPIQYVFQNLFWNAVEHADDTIPDIKVSLQRDAVVSITVTDTGSRIPADEQAALFDPEPRDDSSHGLDLVLAQTLVEGYGGTLELTETSLAGTMFRVTLPRATAPEVTDTAATPARAGRPGPD